MQHRSSSIHHEIHHDIPAAIHLLQIPQLPEGLKDLRLWLEVEACHVGSDCQSLQPSEIYCNALEWHQECAPEPELGVS